MLCQRHGPKNVAVLFGQSGFIGARNIRQYGQAAFGLFDVGGEEEARAHTVAEKRRQIRRGEGSQRKDLPLCDYPKVWTLAG